MSHAFSLFMQCLTVCPATLFNNDKNRKVQYTKKKFGYFPSKKQNQ